jgi:DNA-binding beta-propeller fold protein YncE
MEKANFYKQGMAFDSKGNLYIGDSGDCQIEVFDENLKPLRHFGSIGSGDGQFQYLVDLKIDQDQIFALDLILGLIQVFDLMGTFLYQFETGLPEDMERSHPTGFAISQHQKIFVLDIFNDMKIFDRQGKFLRKLDGLNNQIDDYFGHLYIPVEDMKSDEAGNIYLLINLGSDDFPAIIILNSEGELSPDDPPKTISLYDQLMENGVFAIEGDYLYSALWDPTDQYYTGLLSCMKLKYNLENLEDMKEEDMQIILNNDSSNSLGIDILNPSALLVRGDILYFLDSKQNKITKINTKGEIVATYQSPKSTWEDIKWLSGDIKENMFVADAGKKGIQQINQDMEITGTIGKPGNPDLLPTIGEFYQPYAVVLDSQGYLYCSDSWYNCIQVFSPDHRPFLTFYPPYRIEKATGITINHQGNLLLIDGENKIIYRLDISKIKEKKISMLGFISDVKYASHSVVTNQKEHYLVPVSDLGIMAELSSKGKVIKRGYSSFSRQDKDEFFLPTYIFQDKNQNFIVVDEWLGYFWKFDPSLKDQGSEKLNWFGIQSVWQSNDGTIYAVDRAHSLLIKLRDKSFAKSSLPTDILQNVNIKSLTTNSSIQSFSKVLGISLNDTNSMVFPLENQELMIFFKSSMVTKRNVFATGIVRLDSKGQVLKSELLETGFEKAISLSSGNFLVIGKADNIKK